MTDVLDVPLGTDEVHLGDLIRSVRHRQRLSQRSLALMSGLSLRALREIEQGRVRVPRQDSVERLAEALGEPRLLAHGRDQDGVPYEEDEPLELRVLGPFGAVRGDATLNTGTPKQQSLLALMVLRANQAVPHDEIVEVLWGEDLPNSFNQLIHTYVSRLRALLAPHRTDSGSPTIVRGHAGYELQIETAQLDLLRFQELVHDADYARAADDAELEEELLTQAMALWRGRVLDGASDRLTGHRLAVEYEHQRLDAALRLADLTIAVRGFEQAVRQLRPLVHAHPLHEGLHTRLMMALAGAGQRVAALALFRDLDRRLRTDFGIEPGADLRAAHLSVLRGGGCGPAPAEQRYRGAAVLVG